MDLQLQIQRGTSTATCTPGVMRVAGAPQCYTLERPRFLNGAENVPDLCCILAGTYEVILAMSRKFKRMMPLLVDVPGRSAIEIHWGNFPDDTEGCIIVGQYRTVPCEVTGSILAFDPFFEKLQAAVTARQKIWLEILNG